MLRNYTAMSETKKLRGCKHKFVNPLYNETNEAGDDFKIQCAWCRYVFQDRQELEEEYRKLGVPFKSVPIEQYKRNDINQPDYDPSAPKEHYQFSDYRIPKSSKAVRGNRLQFNGHRWGAKW